MLEKNAEFLFIIFFGVILACPHFPRGNPQNSLVSLALVFLCPEIGFSLSGENPYLLFCQCSVRDRHVMLSCYTALLCAVLLSVYFLKVQPITARWSSNLRKDLKCLYVVSLLPAYRLSPSHSHPPSHYRLFTYEEFLLTLKERHCYCWYLYYGKSVSLHIFHCFLTLVNNLMVSDCNSIQYWWRGFANEINY